MKKLNINWKKWGWIFSLVIVAICFVVAMILFFIWKKDEVPGQIVGALFGTIATGIVTICLLSAQTVSEKSMRLKSSCLMNGQLHIKICSKV